MQTFFWNTLLGVLVGCLIFTSGWMGWMLRGQQQAAAERRAWGPDASDLRRPFIIARGAKNLGHDRSRRRSGRSNAVLALADALDQRD